MRNINTKHLLHMQKNNRGAALALMVILMLLLSISSLTAIQIGRDARLRSVKNNDDIAARYAADAGAERAVYIMNKTLAAGEWNTGAVPAFSSEPLSGANAVYSVTTTGSPAAGYQITSIGHAGGATRTVRIHAKLSNPFALNYAVFSENTVNLKSHSSVRGFDSSDRWRRNLTADIGTMSNNHGSIDIKNGAEVFGDVYVGPTGDPSKVVSMKHRSDIKGELFNQPLPPPLPPVSAPTYLSNKGKLIGKDITLSAKDSGAYSSISIANNGQLRITGHCVLAVSGDIELKNDAEVYITDSGSLTLYLAGDFDAKNSSGVVNTSAVPSKFKLYGTGSKQTIDLKTDHSFFGVIYAPNADMTLYNGGSAYGSFIVNNFEMKNSGHVYYDKALNNPTVIDEAARFVIVRWEEL